MEKSRPKLIGNLDWHDGKDVHISLAYDKVAVQSAGTSYGSAYLMFLSGVGFAQDVKAMRAALAGAVTGPLRLGNVTLSTGEDGYTMTPSNIWCAKTRYLTESHRLGLGAYHALFISRQPGLLMNGEEETLWGELKHPRFTTPLLRAWLPHLKRELKLREILQPCYGLGCELWMLTATTTHLDEIVEHGLKNGLLAIEPEGP